MSDTEQLQHIKQKRKEYNKRYQEKLKQKLQKAEIIEDSEATTDESKSDFFFQKKMTKPTPTPQSLVLKMPETPISQQVKNQLIMGSVALIPMVVTTLLKAYEKKQSNSSAKPSSTQSHSSEPPQPLSFW